MTTEYKTVTKKVRKRITVEVKENLTVHTIPRNENAEDSSKVRRWHPEMIGKLADNLNSAFWFDETAEGATFWFDVLNRINRIGQAKRIPIDVSPGKWDN